MGVGGRRRMLQLQRLCVWVFRGWGDRVVGWGCHSCSKSVGGREPCLTVSRQGQGMQTPRADSSVP